MSDPLWINAGKQTPAIGTATVAASTDLLTLAGHGLANGDTVTVDTLTGGAVGVLVPEAVYFVRDATVDTLGLSLTPAGPLVLFAADGEAAVYRHGPQYNAQELRRAQSVLLTSGGGTTFGARAGLHPADGNAKVTLAGSTITVGSLKAVVYPGLTTLSGPYVVALPQEQHILVPADGTNPRVDAVDLQVQDHDEDASGFRRARSVYTPGVPAGSPVAPPLTANSLRLATILVPAGGAPAPTVTNVYPFTVAAGGILPIPDASAVPTQGRYEGLYVDQRDIDALRRWNGSVWESVASGFVHANAGVTLDRITTGSGTNTTTFTNIPQNYKTLVVHWSGRSDVGTTDIDSVAARFNGDGGDNYNTRLLRGGPGDPGEVSAGGGGIFSVARVGQLTGSNRCGGTFVIPHYSTAGITKHVHGYSSAAHTGTDSFVTLAGGTWNSGGGPAITSIQIWPSGHLWGNNPTLDLIGIP